MHLLSEEITTIYHEKQGPVRLSPDWLAESFASVNFPWNHKTVQRLVIGLALPCQG